jgi:hypothetical protein
MSSSELYCAYCLQCQKIRVLKANTVVPIEIVQPTSKRIVKGLKGECSKCHSTTTYFGGTGDRKRRHKKKKDRKSSDSE